MKVEPLKPADLKHVYFRVGSENIDAASASDRDFDAWIRSRLFVIGCTNCPWSQAERLQAYNQLWMNGKLAMPTEEIRQELEKHENS